MRVLELALISESIISLYIKFNERQFNLSMTLLNQLVQGYFLLHLYLNLLLVTYLIQMKQIAFLLAILIAAASLRIQHSLSSSKHDLSIHQQIIFPPSPTPNPYPNQNNQNTQNYLASLTLEQARDKVIALVPPGPFVDTQKAYELRDFLGTPMGRSILLYFHHRTAQDNGTKGLNRYKLNDANFRLWMAIKIISDNDNNQYIRSVTIDRPLFAELIKNGFPN